VYLTPVFEVINFPGQVPRPIFTSEQSCPLRTEVPYLLA